jgi:hypothetical protein
MQIAAADKARIFGCTHISFGEPEERFAPKQGRTRIGEFDIRIRKYFGVKMPHPRRYSRMGLLVNKGRWCLIRNHLLLFRK